MSSFELVKYDQRDSNRVRIFDSTLREGDQGMDGAFQIDEKIKIAHALDRMGVDIIEAGFPVSSDGDCNAVRAVAQQIEHASVAGLSLLTKESIDTAWSAVEEAAFPRLHVFIPTSKTHLDAMSGWPQERVLEEIAAMVDYAKQTGADVEFSPEDASRTGIDFLISSISVAASAGVDVVNVPDTVGYAQPAQWADRIGRIREAVADDVIVSTHNHNDLGNAVANTVNGVSAGARQVEVAVNGVGERAGNASLEQVLANLYVHHSVGGGSGIEHIDISQVADVSALVARIMGEQISRYRPIVGANAFQHQSGLHASKVLTDASTYEVLRPEEWGVGGSIISYGSHSGSAQFKELLVSRGHEVSDGFEARVREVKELAHRESRSFTECEVIKMFK